MSEAKETRKTIDEALDEFLGEQRARWGRGTAAKYETIIALFKSYLERYWPGHEGAYDQVANAGGTYCGTYGPEEIAGAFGMFLGYFIPHKVIGGRGTEKAAGTVVRKLAKWLVAKGYDAGAADTLD